MSTGFLCSTSKQQGSTVRMTSRWSFFPLSAGKSRACPATRHVNRCATSRVIGEAQIRTTTRHRLTPGKTAVVKKTGDHVLGRTWGKEPSCGWRERALVPPLWGNGTEVPQKLKVEPTYELAVPRLGIDPQELQPGSPRAVCPTALTAAACTMPETGRQPEHLPRDGWPKTTWCNHTMEY